jgi:hypothetical protein
MKMKTTKEIDRRMEIIRENLKEISKIVSALGDDPFFIIAVGAEDENGSIGFNYETHGADLCIAEEVFDVIQIHIVKLDEEIDGLDKAIGDNDPSDLNTWLNLGNVNLN